MLSVLDQNGRDCVTFWVDVIIQSLFPAVTAKNDESSGNE